MSDRYAGGPLAMSGDEISPSLPGEVDPLNGQLKETVLPVEDGTGLNWLEISDENVLEPLSRVIHQALGRQVHDLLMPVVAAKAQEFAFSAGAIVGAGEDLVVSTIELAKLMAMLVMAQMYEGRMDRPDLSGFEKFLHATRTRMTEATLRLTPVGLVYAAAQEFGLVDESQLKNAYERREALKEVIEYLMQDPIAAGKALGSLVVKQWHEYKRLVSDPSLESQFKAGKMFGPVMLEVVFFLAGGGAKTLATAGGKVLAALRRANVGDAGEAVANSRSGARPGGSTKVDTDRPDVDSSSSLEGGSGRGQVDADSTNAGDSSAPATSGNETPSRRDTDEVKAGEPVSVTSGEELLVLPEFTLPGPLPIVWNRTYRSGNDVDTGHGHGWTYSYGEWLEETASGVDVFDDEGRRIPFVKLDIGQSTRHRMEGSTLERESHARYRLTLASRISLTFAGPGPRKRLIEVRDSNANAVQLHYDTAGRLERLSRNQLQGLRIEYDAAGRMRALYRTDAAGERLGDALARYRYDEAGDLIEAVDAAGHAETYTYHHHLITARKLRSGLTYGFEWDGQDKNARCVRSFGERGVYDTRFDYDVERRITRVTDGRGFVIVYHYDTNGRVTREQDRQGGVTRTTYTAAGKVASLTGPNGATTRYRYDTRDRLVQVIDPTGASHELRYDTRDNPVRLSDPLGQAWGRHYDARGNLILAADPLGNESRYRYNARGLPTTLTDPLGHTRTLTWDAHGRLAAATDARGLVSTYTYNDQDLIETVTVGDGEPTRYTYDAMGRPLTVTDPAGNTSWLAYDEEGRLTRHVDPSGRKTEYRYAPGLSQVIERIDPDGTRFAYEYDAERNLTALINQNGERYTLEYDGAERLTREVGFDGREQRYYYDTSGFLIEHEDAPGVDGERHFTTFKRDPLGRLLEKRSSDGQVSTFAYDPLGRVTRADNAVRNLAFTYDPCGRLEQEHQDERIIAHRYDALGRRIASALPEGERVEYRYDEEGGFRELELDGESLTRIERDTLGRTIAQRQGVLDTEYDYDPAGRLARQRTVAERARTPLIDCRYRYDATGNLTHIADLKGTTHFTYDPLDRITAVTGVTAETFAFDPAGNLLDTTAPAAGGYVKGNRLLIHGDAKFEYDPAGNLIRETSGRGGWRITEYRYDHQNQLTEVIRDGQHVVFEYDALGRRTKKSSPAGETRFYWNGDQLLSEQSDWHSKSYLHAPGSFVPLAQVHDEEVY
ncbi:MAG: DUF6531 domain-containing protein, partial [Gammaproteobacteria bacterium]